jgi:8-oxo-dGTP pyrophosphatase MutT (NUDIX family)
MTIESVFDDVVSRILRQIAALPLHFAPDGSLEVYLVTSRGSGRWIIPKGNPIKGLTPEEVAAREAFEEAGLVGRIVDGCLGTFEFERSGEICLVEVYPMHVEKQLRRFDEKRQRKVQRCSLKTACTIVCSSALASLIQNSFEQYHSQRLALVS